MVKQEPSAYENQTIKTLIAWRQQRADVPVVSKVPYNTHVDCCSPIKVFHLYIEIVMCTYIIREYRKGRGKYNAHIAQYRLTFI